MKIIVFSPVHFEFLKDTAQMYRFEFNTVMNLMYNVMSFVVVRKTVLMLG
jgi:hypothetical protein